MAELRTNVGFIILEVTKTGMNEEVVIGYNPHNGDHKFVTWVCYKGNNYNNGHYCTNITDAVKDYNRRINR